MTLSLPNPHPFLVHFPLALFTFALALDAVLLARVRSPWLDRTVTLLFGASAIFSAIAAFSGKLAENAIERALTPGAQERLGLHSDWAFFSVVLLFVVAALRFDVFWRDRAEPAIRIQRGRLIALGAAVLAVAALLTTAGHGGALVYRHGVGVESRLP